MDPRKQKLKCKERGSREGYKIIVNVIVTGSAFILASLSKQVQGDLFPRLEETHHHPEDKELNASDCGRS